ncbi:hypothetical protein JCM4814A_81100 [Streptomyces phaeofaciens JCM 4814]|uniref:YD repeat-containing protein n=1 Tax=Streptomyces phaeofaciens TaxID=68254 RepID=A0A918HSG9_9ACTN|nr:hypothetical protein [Streptomyces phaeofaciens]GGT99409.1 hypothetical protein GCM10010226_90640 [Streptomyces phaeofaciens]
MGNVTATTDYGTGTTAALRTATAEYDMEGNRTAAIAAQTNARTTYTYDALGRMTGQVEPVSCARSVRAGGGHGRAARAGAAPRLAVWPIGGTSRSVGLSTFAGTAVW